MPETDAALPVPMTWMLRLTLPGVFWAALSASGSEAVSRRRPAAPAEAVATPRAIPTNSLPVLPPAPEGVTHLDFEQFFKKPVGPRGLELTDTLQSFNDRKVRLLGYMVKQERRTPGVFLLSPVPASTHESHYGLADDLPASTVHVFVPTMKYQVLPHTPGLMLLTGQLEVGNREEASGRVSTIRLTLDPPTVTAGPGATNAAPAVASASLSQPVSLPPNN